MPKHKVRPAVIAVVVAIAVALVALTGPPERRPTASMPSSARTLTGTSAGCTITEGQTSGTCVISISPAAPSGSSLTFAVAAQTKGTAVQAFSPVDSNGRAPGGTGPDVAVVGSSGNSVTVNIPTGATSVAFPVTAVNDDFTELDKTITATISAAVGVTIDAAASTTTITVLDNDRTGIFPVSSYGATPDDGVSDSAAIQAAIAAANASGRGVVTFSSGQYDTSPATSGPLRPNPGIAMSGAGDRATVIRRMALQCGSNYPLTPRCSVKDILVDQYNASVDSPWLILSNIVLDGNNGNQGVYKDFRLEHSHLAYFSGAIDTGTARAYNTGRLRVITQHLTTRSGVADGLSFHVNVESRDWDTRGEGNFRGHLVLTGGNSVAQWWDFTTTHGGATGLTENTGFDIEVDAYGRHPSKGLTVDIAVDIRHVTLDSALDASTYLPPDWMYGCFTPTGTTQCGTGSTITIDDLHMQPSGGTYFETGGDIFLGVMRSQDVISITNSTLRWGGHYIYNENQVWLNQGTINIVDTRNIVGEYPYPNHASGYTQPSLQVASMQQSFSGGTLNLVRSSFEADTAPNTPSSKCASERMHPTLPTINWASVTIIGTGWCNSNAGYTGGAVNVSTAPAGVTTTTTSTTTTTAVPSAPTYDDAAGAFAWSPLASPPTTTTSPSTTTTTPSATRKEFETCTLGGSVITTSGSPSGVSGSGIFGNAAVGSGTTASCSVTAASAGTYDLTLRYQNAGSYLRPLSVNGSALSPPTGPTFPATGNAWTTIVFSVTLASGSNTIVLDASYQWFDWLEISQTGGVTTTTTTPATTTTTTTTLPPEASGWVAYGPSGVNDPRDYAATNHTTSASSATATITFTGTSAELWGATGPAFGQATVSVDGGAATTIDAYSATEARQVQLWSTSGLSSGSHTIVVTVTHTKQAASTGYYIALDKLTYGSVVTTTTIAVTTTTVITARSVTIDAFQDLDGDGVRDLGEPRMAKTVFRVVSSTGVVVARGTINSASVVVSVPAGAGYQVRYFPPLQPTTPVVITLPTSTSAKVFVGGCCPVRIHRRTP